MVTGSGYSCNNCNHGGGDDGGCGDCNGNIDHGSDHDGDTDGCSGSNGCNDGNSVGNSESNGRDGDSNGVSRGDYDSNGTFPVRGSQAFCIAYIHTQNNTTSYVGNNSNSSKIYPFEARNTPAPRATLPTTTAQEHTRHNKHRPLTPPAATPDQSRLNFYLAPLLHR
jgi:hypothetical protein